MNAPNGSFIALPQDVGDMWERFTSLQVDYELHEHTLYTNPAYPGFVGDTKTLQRDFDFVETQTFTRVAHKVGATSGEFELYLADSGNQKAHEMRTLLRFVPVVSDYVGEEILIVSDNADDPPAEATFTSDIAVSMPSVFYAGRLVDASTVGIPAEIGLRSGRSGTAGSLANLYGSFGGVYPPDFLFPFTDLLTGLPITFTYTRSFPDAEYTDTTGSVTETITIQLS